MGAADGARGEGGGWWPAEQLSFLRIIVPSRSAKKKKKKEKKQHSVSRSVTAKKKQKQSKALCRVGDCAH